MLTDDRLIAFTMNFSLSLTWSDCLDHSPAVWLLLRRLVELTYLCEYLHLVCDYFLSFLLKINAFPMRYEIWKGRKKVWLLAGSNLGRSCQKAYALPSTPLKLMLNWHLFLVLTIPINTLVDGVCVNSLCQQWGLFALIVNIGTPYLETHIAK